MLTKSKDPREQAIGELRRIAAALVRLGGTATVADIAKAAELPRERVQNRLRGASAALMGTHVVRLFVCERTKNIKEPSNWSLTAKGRELGESK